MIQESYSPEKLREIIRQAKKQLKAQKEAFRRKTLEDIAIALITGEKLEKYQPIIPAILNSDTKNLKPPIQKLVNFIKTYYKTNYQTTYLEEKKSTSPLSEEKKPKSTLSEIKL